MKPDQFLKSLSQEQRQKIELQVQAALAFIERHGRPDPAWMDPPKP